MHPKPEHSKILLSMCLCTKIPNKSRLSEITKDNLIQIKDVNYYHFQIFTE